MTPEKLDRIEALLSERFADLPKERLSDIVIVHVTPQQLVATMTRLRDDPDLNFTQMIDLAGVHYPERAQPFEVVYQLLSVHKNHRLRVKVALAEDQPVPSVIPVWSCADWFEREAYDLFGILFTGHPDLRRILNDYDFDGHPLRKDFPVTGRYEVRFDETLGRLVREPVVLERAFREPYRHTL
ncbi:MAG: NADH-quinone oxidoreductase subunit C [Magnetococcales bacterium]|nr:NADH-quinone oxidoreductase subunit C [Magnetococcales bacterium]NGZ05994.1 NADH-quinone oxidoreductase subunit C [Magnetococcales bacterium]